MVKGHATKEDVEARTSTAADKEGNDKRDVNADERVEKIKGKGFEVLGNWITERHDQYKKLRERIHEMIVVITLVAKAVRDKADKIQKILLAVRSQSLGWKQKSNYEMQTSRIKLTAE